MDKKTKIALFIAALLILGALYFLTRKTKNVDMPIDDKAPKFSPSILKLSPAGEKFLKQEEGLRLVPYPDAGGWSVGYGHYLGKNKGLPITQAIADQYFKEDSAVIEKYLARVIKVNISQALYDALFNLAYNSGPDFGAGLLGLVNSSAPIDQIAAKIKQYNKTGQPLKVSPELAARREREVKTFLV